MDGQRDCPRRLGDARRAGRTGDDHDAVLRRANAVRGRRGDRLPRPRRSRQLQRLLLHIDSGLIMIVSVAVPERSTRHRSTVGAVLCALVTIALAVGVVSWRLQDRGTRVTAAPGAKMPGSATIEQNWGIRFVALSVLADGGLIELRYQVVDPAK